MKPAVAAMSNPKFRKLLFNAIIVIIVLIIIYIVYRKVNKAIKEAKAARQSKESVAASENAIIVNALTYADSDYHAMADKLFRAMDGAGTDTDAIEEVISKIRTKSDWNAIVKAFDIRETTAWYSRFKGNLIEWLTDELSDNSSSRQRINNMLAKFNITV
jgi:uncharacterized protein (UPF0333 family)